MLHNNHTRLGTVTLPLFHHMSNMAPKEVEEHCSSYDTWGVLGLWLKGTEGQIAFIQTAIYFLDFGKGKKTTCLLITC